MGILLLFLAIMALFFVFMIATGWKVFEKAGAPGWASLVPIYNMYVMTTVVAGKEPLWFWLQFVPFVNIYISIMEAFAVAQKFGKDTPFGLGLLFLPFVFFPILAFGDAEHESQTRRRSHGRDYGDYEEEEDEDEDRPRHQRRDEDDEEEVERPAKRRRVVDEDEDDRPSKHRRPADDDDDDDRPAPRRRRD